MMRINVEEDVNVDPKPLKYPTWNLIKQNKGKQSITC